MAETTQEHSGQSKPQGLHLFVTGEARLALWQKLRGMWKNRQPNPLEELTHIRDEWSRNLPPLR